MLIRLFLTFFLLLMGPLFAAPDLQQPLMLGELVDIALQNHPSTRQAWWYANRAAAALGSAESAYYPKIDFDAYVTHGRDFKFINGPDTNFTIIGADLILSLLLFDAGERNANVISAKKALQAARWEMDWNIQKVVIDVLENAYSLLHAEEVVRGAHISLTEAERMLDAALELNQAGLSPISDVYTSRATFAQMKIELARQRSLRDIQKVKLATSLGISSEVSIELAPIENPQCPNTQQTDELVALAYRQRSDLMAKQAKVAESLANQAKTRASYGGRLSLTGNGGANRAIRDKANVLQYEITLNLDIPLFNGFETMYQNRMAFADARLSMEELAQLELDISLEVLTHSFLLKAAQEMLPDADEDLKNSIKAYESVLERYQAGKERITEISNAQRQLAEARVRYSDIKTRWLVSIAKLAYATGTLAPYLESRCEKIP
jgi:outer membrane protein TolC